MGREDEAMDASVKHYTSQVKDFEKDTVSKTKLNNSKVMRAGNLRGFVWRWEAQLGMAELPRMWIIRRAPSRQRGA
jgi:hypothetical protein